MKVPGSGFYRVVKPLKGGFLWSFEGFEVDPPSSICLPVEWREVIKRLLPVKLGVIRGPPLEMPTISSLVVAMLVEDLRSFR